MATEVQTRLESLAAKLRALEKKLARHLEEHAKEEREWEEIKRSILEEVRAESLEEFENRELSCAGPSRLDALMESMTYEEWLRLQEQD